MLKIAETEDNNLYNDSVKPLSMSSNVVTVTDEGKNYIAGPFKIEKYSDDFSDFSYQVTDGEGNKLTTYTILDKDKNSTGKTIEDLIGEDFYIKITQNK